MVIGQGFCSSALADDSPAVPSICDVQLGALQERSQNSGATAVGRLLSLDSPVEQLVQLLESAVLHKEKASLSIE